MEAKHTLGPWFVSDHNEEIAVDKDGLRVAASYGETRNQREANARLIAAAPELLDALDHIAKTIDRQLELIADRAKGDFLDKHPVVQSLQSHMRRARAAVANASGEAK